MSEIECNKSPTGQHLYGTYYSKLSGCTEFIYTDKKEKHKGKDNYCEFNLCPFCGESLTDKGKGL